MQLTKFSDYALRVIVHLAASPEALMSTRQIAEIHGAKYNHMAKVTGWLVAEGYAVSLRGRAGGLRLARAPEQINLGSLLRRLEADQPLVECHGAGPSGCRLAPACGLSIALASAQEAFYQALDRYSLADVAQLSPRMPGLLAQLNAVGAE